MPGRHLISTRPENGSDRNEEVVCPERYYFLNIIIGHLYYCHGDCRSNFAINGFFFYAEEKKKRAKREEECVHTRCKPEVRSMHSWAGSSQQVARSIWMCPLCASTRLVVFFGYYIGRAESSTWFYLCYRSACMSREDWIDWLIDWLNFSFLSFQIGNLVDYVFYNQDQSKDGALFHAGDQKGLDHLYWSLMCRLTSTLMFRRARKRENQRRLD